MKFNFFSSLFFAIFILTSCSDNDDSSKVYEEIVAVANRGSGTVSLFDANTNQLKTTISIPNSEPMYVVYVSQNDRVYVGDRSGNKIHVINPSTGAIERNISVGNGVFHMWADGLGKQLWVNNDIDNTISVIDLSTHNIVQTINVGMKPHDVFLSKDATTAYVSVFNSTTTLPDKIFSYSTNTYMKTGEVNVGKDPHLFHLSSSNKLFVACQSGELYVLNGSNLSTISSNPFEGAHGIFASPDQSTIFMTNISGQKLYSINSSNYQLNGSAVNSLSATPHNIVVNEAGNKMFVTHSGASANKVSAHSLNGVSIGDGVSLNAGINPFGLTYYKRIVN